MTDKKSDPDHTGDETGAGKSPAPGPATPNAPNPGTGTTYPGTAHPTEMPGSGGQKSGTEGKGE